MTKFMVLYRAPLTTAEQVASSTPEEMEASMGAWMAWAGKAGSAIVDFGSPVATAAVVGADGGAGGGHIGGFSVLEAESVEALTELLDGHPHLSVDGAAIEVLEFLPVPGS